MTSKARRESTQNALMILIQLVRDHAQKIKVPQADIEHLQNIAGEQESPQALRDARRATDARINEL